MFDHLESRLMATAVSIPPGVMAGTQVVTLVLPESDGVMSTENWTATQINAVIAEVQTGLAWWEKVAAKSGVTVKFILDTNDATFPVRVPYEPISMRFSDRGQWITNWLNQRGIFTDAYNGVKAWNESQRVRYGADGSFTIFVADSDVDADDRFADRYFAWTYFGGPYATMTTGNAGWGQSNMDMLTAHETGHAYFALDQYNDGTAWSSYYAISPGVFKIQNTNAIRDRPATAPPRETSIMREGSNMKTAFLAVNTDTSSKAMVFGPDLNKNGTPDWMETP